MFSVVTIAGVSRPAYMTSAPMLCQASWRASASQKAEGKQTLPGSRINPLYLCPTSCKNFMSTAGLVCLFLGLMLACQRKVTHRAALLRCSSALLLVLRTAGEACAGRILLAGLCGTGVAQLLGREVAELLGGSQQTEVASQAMNSFKSAWVPTAASEIKPPAGGLHCGRIPTCGHQTHALCYTRIFAAHSA